MQAEAARHGITEAEALKRSVDRTPLGRLAEAEEIAAVAVFAASPRASYLTGTLPPMTSTRHPSRSRFISRGREKCLTITRVRRFADLRQF